MAQKICTHLPTSHEHPKNETDLYDNLSLLLEHIQAVFAVIEQATEAQPDPSVSQVASMGGCLCAEAMRRAEALYTYQPKGETEATKTEATWTPLLDLADEVRAFITEHEGELKPKDRGE